MYFRTISKIMIQFVDINIKYDCICTAVMSGKNKNSQKITVLYNNIFYSELVKSIDTIVFLKCTIVMCTTCTLLFINIYCSCYNEHYSIL